LLEGSVYGAYCGIRRLGALTNYCSVFVCHIIVKIVFRKTLSLVWIGNLLYFSWWIRLLVMQQMY